MKPTKMRNQMIYQADYQTKSRQLGSALSKDLRKKYGKRSVRVIEGDSVTVTRGEFKGVDSKVSEVSTQKSSVALEGVKKEATKGEKFDVYIHTSNLLVTSLNGDDRWRVSKLEGKDPKRKTADQKEAKSDVPAETAKEKPDKQADIQKEKPDKQAETLKEKPSDDMPDTAERMPDEDTPKDAGSDQQSQEIKGQGTKADDNQEGNDK